MEATSKITREHKQENLLIALFNQQADIFEKARFGWMTFYITIQSCLGAIAAAFILQNNANIWMLCSCAAISMASNAVFIALGDKKLCLVIFYASIILNTAFILANW
ncbi:MAG: hypothetical protein H0U95_14605 [Bacteroidetes bacterium]|nr:hypothetical protein [Bacteroidota bacterium]